MEATRNLCAQIPVSLHDRVREERESLGQSLSEYVTQILKAMYQKIVPANVRAFVDMKVESQKPKKKPREMPASAVGD